MFRKIEKPATSRARDFETSLNKNSKIMIGAEVDGKIVGFVIVKIRQSEYKIQTPHTYAYFETRIIVEKELELQFFKTL